MKTIFILGAGPLQIPAIRKAKEKGLYVYVLDYDANAPGIPYADFFLPISTLDREAVCRAALERNPDYIITSTSDMPVRTVSWVNEKLGKASDLSYEDSICATDKAAMRRRMQRCGVPLPEFHVIKTERELREIASETRRRLIIKPTDNSASRGVALIDPSQSPDYAALFAFSQSYSRSGEVMVEEFMVGPEVSVESYTVNGKTNIIAVTDKIVTPPPFFVELGHIEPSVLPEETLEEIRRVTLSAVVALRMRNGPNHTELKITPKGVKLVEIAARLGGDYITSRLVPLSTGVDMIECSFATLFGQEPDCEAKFHRGAAIRFLRGNPGILERIENVTEAKAMQGVVEIECYKKSGDSVSLLKSSSDRIGHIIAVGKDAEEAALRTEEALSMIHVVTTPPRVK